MTLIIAIILLNHVDASWGSYVLVSLAWVGHLVWQKDL